MAMHAGRCGPTALGSRGSWGPAATGGGNFDRIFNAFERTNAFEYIRNTFEEGREREERSTGHSELVVNRKMSSSFERADCALAAQTPCSDDDEEFYREKILYSQARQLFPLQEDLADWINKTIGITYLSGENFLDVLDNGVELCQLAAIIHDRAKDALDLGLIVGPVPGIRGRCWQRAARRSFFSRDNTENFITFCRELGVHENLLFESDDLVLHNQPRQVILCLLEVARLATRYAVEPPGLVALEKEIAMEERDSGLDSAMSGAAWQFRDASPVPAAERHDPARDPTSTPDPRDDTLVSLDDGDAESTKSDGTAASTDSDVPLKPTNELDKRVQLVTRLMERGCSCGEGKCSKLLKVKKVGEGRYNIAGRNVFIRLLKGRHMMVRVGGGWDTLEHFLSRHEPCQVRLVTQGRKADVLPLPPDEERPSSGSGASRRPSGTASPVDSKASSISGKQSPVERRTSTPKPKTPRSALTLPLTEAPRTRKSVPSFSTPSTPTGRSVRMATPKKSRSMSLAYVKEVPFCGTDRLNQRKASAAPKGRSQSLATTPVSEQRKITGSLVKKTRSMSLATPAPEVRQLGRSMSLANGPITQAAIEESIRLSLAASIADTSSPKKPFLHIKAKYRSPPPREVPPR